MRRLIVPLALVACAPRLSPATAQQLAIAAAAPGSQLAGDDPAAPAGDLPGLASVVGDARIVGLGQPGPGARELPRVYHRFVRYLVEETGFTGLALDADATATLTLDAYVGGAELELEAALLALGDRGLATAELRDLLLWMRAHSRGPGVRLRVFGLDPRDPAAAATVVLGYLERVDAAYVPEARSLLASGQQLGVDAVLARLDQRRDAYLAAADPAAWATARQQAEVVAQARRMAETWEFEAGEFARARNVEWSLAQLGPRGKLIVWADNQRIAAQVAGAAPSMGDFLRQWFAADYRPIAASFAGGALLVATSEQRLCGAPLPPPRAGSLDAALAGLGAPLVLIDLRGRSEPELRAPQELRSFTGAQAEPTRVRPAIAFDAVLAVHSVRPATPLGTGPEAAAHPHGPCYVVLPR